MQRWSVPVGSFMIPRTPSPGSGSGRNPTSAISYAMRAPSVLCQEDRPLRQQDWPFGLKETHTAQKTGFLVCDTGLEKGPYDPIPVLGGACFRQKNWRCRKAWPRLSVRLAARSSPTRFLFPKTCEAHLCTRGQRLWQICAPRPDFPATRSHHTTLQTAGKFS